MEEIKPVVESKRGIRRRAIAEDGEAIMEVKPKVAEKLFKRQEASKRNEIIVNLHEFRLYSMLPSLQDEVKPAPTLRKRSTSTNKTSMKIGSSEDEESEGGSSGDESESKMEARVTRSRAAADPSVQIIR